MSDVNRLWQQVISQDLIQPLTCGVYRVVESQQTAATMNLTDTAEEQWLLEQLLETVKPDCPLDSDAYHYLIKTPFRYPPLRHGSRFGRRFEPSLYYASLDIKTALTECAYYRLLFFYHMSAPPKSNNNSEYSSFKANSVAQRSLRLESRQLAEFQTMLTDKKYYHFTHALGTHMREHDVQSFTFHSARANDKNAVNFAAFELSAMVCAPPSVLKHWTCITQFSETQVTRVQFLRNDRRKQLPTVYTFSKEDFMADGDFPCIAS